MASGWHQTQIPEFLPNEGKTPLPILTQSIVEENGLLGIIPVNYTRQCKVPLTWQRAYSEAQHILVEFDYGRLYRAYHLTSTINYNGNHNVTKLLFFLNEPSMNQYITVHNLPTEKFHSYTVRQLAPSKYLLKGFKMRFNGRDRAAYLSLPITDGYITNTNIQVGDTVSLTLHNKLTNTMHTIALHKILMKKDNYCAISLSPNATEYYCKQYGVDQQPLLATLHIDLTIERVNLKSDIQSMRFDRVFIAKPRLLERIFREKGFFQSLVCKVGYKHISNIELQFLTAGRVCPDIEFIAENNNQSVHVIGECKACNCRYSQRTAREAAIQLLFYKIKSKPATAQGGLLVITGSPIKPKWNQLMKLIISAAKRKSKNKATIYSKKLISISQNRFTRLKTWYENQVALITGNTIREVIKETVTPELRNQYTAIIDFIEN